MDRPIETLSTKLVYENRWMKVREDGVRRADGAVGIYGVVEKPDFALVIPLGEGSVFLVEQYRYPVGGRYIEFPRGSWEAEPHVPPEELARRELVEETGLTAGSMRHLGHLYEAYGSCDEGFDVFLATDLVEGRPTLSVEEQDLRTIEVPVAELERRILSGTIKDAPSIAAWELHRLWESSPARG